MPSPTFHALRFRLIRHFRAFPVLSWLIVLLIGALAISALILLSQARAAWTLNAELAQLRAAKLSATPEIARILPMPIAGTDLPPFHSATLVAVLNQTAADSDLTLDEVSYALDDGANQPYLRYRVNLTVNAGYPLTRRLTEQLDSKLPHLTLDAISCARKEPRAAALSCDLAFSAFFQREKHG